MGRKMMILLLSLVFGLGGFSAWADDDAIIDIDNHVASFSGTWGTESSPILFYGDDFRWAACSGNDVWTSLWSDPTNITREATFSSNQAGILPDISGDYAVYVRWVAHPNRTDSARYRIFDGTTQTYLGGCTKDQRSRGGEWVYCTTVSLTAGNVATVKLGNNCESGKYVVADAVRFVRVSKDKDDIIDEAGMEYAYGDQSLSLSTTPVIVRSFTITAPASGYVMLNASGYMYVNNAIARCWFTTGTSTTIDFGTLIYFNFASSIYWPFAATKEFSVSSGSTQFNLVCDKYSGTSAYVYDTSLTGAFFPTRY